jgi:4-hydroxy-tetrahydrodipicolinate synthase
MFKGSIVALVTPFKQDRTVDQEKLRYLIDWHIKNKTDGILLCGTTGESATLSHQEHKYVIDIGVQTAKGKIPIIAGAGSNSTQEALDLVQYAQRKGADAALVITPYYNKPTQRGLYQHYKVVSQSVKKMPIIIYNVPGRTGINILPQTVAEIYKDCKNIIGIKEASGSMKQITELMTFVDRKFILLSGSDEITLAVLSVGGSGVVSVVANIMPKEMHSLVDSFLKGNMPKARSMQLYLFKLIDTLFIETNPIPVKASMELMGLIANNLRLPLYRLENKNLQVLKKVLKEYQLIK